MKILSLILISLFFASSLQFSPDYIKESRIRDERVLDLTGALMAVVDQLIQTVSNALNNLLTTVGNLILNGISSIEEAITKAIDKFISDFQEAKDEVEKLITEEVIGCFQNLEEGFQNIKNETIDAITICYDEGKGKLMSISDDSDKYVERNREIISNVKSSIESCFTYPSFGDKVKCAVDAANTIRDAIGNLTQNIEYTAKNITFKIEDSIKGSYDCIQSELQLGEDAISNILEGVRECIESSSPTTTTEEPVTEPTIEDSSTDSTNFPDSTDSSDSSDFTDSSDATDSTEPITDGNSSDPTDSTDANTEGDTPGTTVSNTEGDTPGTTVSNTEGDTPGTTVSNTEGDTPGTTVSNTE